MRFNPFIILQSLTNTIYVVLGTTNYILFTFCTNFNIPIFTTHYFVCPIILVAVNRKNYLHTTWKLYVEFLVYYDKISAICQKSIKTDSSQCFLLAMGIWRSVSNDFLKVLQVLNIFEMVWFAGCGVNGTMRTGGAICSSIIGRKNIDSTWNSQ